MMKIIHYSLLVIFSPLLLWAWSDRKAYELHARLILKRAEQERERQRPIILLQNELAEKRRQRKEATNAINRPGALRLAVWILES